MNDETNKAQAPEGGAPVDPVPTHTITIAGVSMEVPAPYSEGHTLTATEAAVLNQTYSENIRNNFASTVKKAKESAEEAGTEVDEVELQLSLDEYVSGYQFGVRRGGGGSRTPMDPVDKEAKRIAESKVKVALKKKGIAFKDVDKDNFNEVVTRVIAENPQIREAAEAIVAARQEVGEGTLDLDI